MRFSGERCEHASTKLEEMAIKKGRFNFLRWLTLNTFYMRGFAKTGKKQIFKTILANVLLFGTQPLMLLFGLVSAPFEYSRLKREAKSYKEAASQERERAETYSRLSITN